METQEKTYWLKQAKKHTNMARTLREKFELTKEVRWLNQAVGNEKKACAIQKLCGRA